MFSCFSWAYLLLNLDLALIAILPHCKHVDYLWPAELNLDVCAVLLSLSFYSVHFRPGSLSTTQSVLGHCCWCNLEGLVLVEA